jgi:starch-binding outer membrane protein, SusD/RagB family
MKILSKYMLIFVIPVFMGLLFSCEDLNVENLNDPDTARVLSSPDDVRSVAQGTFLSYWQATRATNIHITSLVAADQFTCSWGNFWMRWISNEPRIPWDNKITAANDQVSENFFINSYASLSQINDALKLIADGMEIGVDGVDNPGIQSFGYFMQGWILGNIGLAFDQGYVVKENTDLGTLQFQPYQEIVDSALISLKKAITIATNAADFTLAETTINGVTVNNSLIIELSHSYIARFLALTPRTAAQSDDVDWNEVLTHANAGITEDFGPTGDGSPYEGATWWDENFIYLVQPGWARIDNRLINLMDPAYPARYWSDGVAQVVHGGLTAGQAQSLDNRLTTDFEFLPSVDFNPSRGYYHYSHYRFSRFDASMYVGLGTLYEFRAYENKLLAAEASARLNDLPAAIAILNDPLLPRIARGGLSNIPGTASQEDVLKAIFYEREIELLSQGFMIGNYDMRRRDMLQSGSLLNYPVPGKELETLGLPVYTYGGVANADGINTSNGGWFE